MDARTSELRSRYLTNRIAGCIALALLLFASAPTASADPSWTAGKRVKFLGGQLRSAPAAGTSTSKAAGVFGSIAGGPTTVGGAVWWQVDFDSNPDGWVTETTLRDAGATSIANIADNTWTKLATPARSRFVCDTFSDCSRVDNRTSPSGREYSGPVFGDGKIFYFGGAHSGYPGNDAELFDTASLTWTQQYAPEGLPACCGGGSVASTCAAGSPEQGACTAIGGGAPSTASPLGRPYTEHTYQRIAYDEGRDKYYAAVGSGLWSYEVGSPDPWTRLTTSNPSSGDIGNKLLIYDPDLQTVVLIMPQGSYRFNHASAAWVKTSTKPPFSGGDLNSAYDPVGKRHLVSFVKQSGYWWYDAVNDSWQQLAGVPDVLKDSNGWWPASYAYDPLNQRFLIARAPNQKGSAALELWTLDRSNQWTQISTAGPSPFGEGRFQSLWYDGARNLFWLVNRPLSPGLGGPTRDDSVEMWVWRNVPATSASPGSFHWNTGNETHAETGGSVSFQVERSWGSTGVASVSYATGDASAEANSDYLPTSGTVQFADGETAPKTVSVPVLDDSIREGDEAFTVTLSNPTGGATVSSPTTVTVTVTDDEVVTQPLTVTASAAPSSLVLPENSSSLSASTNSDGSIVGHQWSETLRPPGAPASTLTGSGALRTAGGLSAGTYVFRVQVTDNTGATAVDDVSVVVEPAPGSGEPPPVGPGSQPGQVDPAPEQVRPVLDRTPPRVVLTGASHYNLAALRRGLPAGVECDESCSVVGRATIAVNGRGSSAPTSSLQTLSPHRAATVRFKFPRPLVRKARAALFHGRGVSIAIGVRATDAAGNATSRSRRIRLRPTSGLKRASSSARCAVRPTIAKVLRSWQPLEQLEGRKVVE